MSIRTLLILAAVAMALILFSPVKAAPPAQFGIEQSTNEQSITGQPAVQQIAVDSTGAFTLTIKIDEVTTVAIPLRVNWRAQGPLADNPDQVSVVISPTVLETGIFPVAVSAIEATTGTLAITLTQPTNEIAPLEPITNTPPTTPTTPETTVAVTSTTPTADTNAPTTNAISNLRAGPGTDYAIIATIPAGERLDIIGRNEDGAWLALANNSWIFSTLVNNPPQELPVVQPVAAPLVGTSVPITNAPPPATPTPSASLIITPTPTP